MIVAIHQPEYLPWVGYFEKVLRADVFVLLDDAQFSKGDYQNRNRVKGRGGAQWLTVPVVHSLPSKIKDVKVANHLWRKKHWQTLVTCYSRARFFRDYADVFEAFYRRASENLIDYDVWALELIARCSGIEKNWVLASDLNVAGQKSERVLNICRKLGATVYYSGRQGSTYLKRDDFARAGIEIKVQSFTHPTYEQMFMSESGFIPNLSVVDLLFNGGAQSGVLLRSLSSDGG
jgi:hypothetical protein